MTFHGLITGLVVLAVLLGLAALESWRRSRRRPLDGWRYEVLPYVERWTDSLESMRAVLELSAMTANDVREAFDRLSVFLSDFRYWLDEWEWEQ